MCFFLSNKGFKHSQFMEECDLQGGGALGSLGLHPLYFPPFVRVCFGVKHTLNLMGPCISHLVVNPLLEMRHELLVLFPESETFDEEEDRRDIVGVGPSGIKVIEEPRDLKGGKESLKRKDVEQTLK